MWKDSLSIFKVILILVVGTMVMYSQKSNNQELAAFLPEVIEGWRAQSPDREYDRQRIYEYLNGGAELYLTYDFHTLLNRTYVQAGQPDIMVDIFDMGHSKDAFGAFSHSRESAQADYGQGSEYYKGFMLFWRDRYLVSIVANPETDASRQAIRALAAVISKQIGHDGPLPAVLEHLPEKGLNEGSLRYFHNHVWMNIHYFIADENILLLDRDTEAVVATYGESPDRLVLLLLAYPSSERATEAERNFKHHYLPDLKTGNALQLEDGMWAGIRRTGNMVVVVLNSSDKEIVLQFLKQVVFEP